MAESSLVNAGGICASRRTSRAIAVVDRDFSLTSVSMSLIILGAASWFMLQQHVIVIGLMLSDFFLISESALEVAEERTAGPLTLARKYTRFFYRIDRSIIALDKEKE